jgi:hypothetical protein
MKYLPLFLFIAGTLAASEPPNTVSIPGIPKPMEWIIKPEAFKQTEAEIAITAGANTNMFYAPHGNFNVSNMPKLVFTPESDFTLVSKARTQHKTKWEAAMLVVYIDENYWAKLCFENQEPGIQRMVSVVTNKVSDDAYSDIITNDSVYMRVSKSGKQIEFAYSQNGSQWIGIRYFRLDSEKPLKVGFSSQSPIGEGLTSYFSEIKYTKKD